MGKYIAIIPVSFLLLASLGCDYFPPRTVDDGNERLSEMVDDYVAECDAITPFGTEKYEDTESNLKLAKINEGYLTRAETLAKQIEAIEPGEGEGDALKELHYHTGLFLYVLETRAEAFDMIDEDLGEGMQMLMSARFAVVIEQANEKMREVQSYLF